MIAPDRAWFARDPVLLAPALLGASLTRHSPEGDVTVTITEVEAYRGSDDPGAHSFRGRTERTRAMFGEAGHLYCYLSYGMHHNLNVVAGHPGEGYGVLLHAGHVVAGESVARARRERTPRRTPIREHELARGPGNLGRVLDASLADNCADLLAAPWTIRVLEAPPGHLTGPRVGLSGPGGDGEQFPWRFWLPGDRSVSAYRPAVTRSRPS